MEQRNAKGIGGVGPLVKVTWLDAAQQIKIHTLNFNKPEAHLAVCETIGELVFRDSKALILVQHVSDTYGIDILAIPRDWTQKVEVLEVVGEECTIENLESQQESPSATTSKTSKSK